MKEFGKRPKNCPLISVPTPHGMLIDADALEYEQIGTVAFVREQFIRFAPTVIEAEGNEK